MAHHFALTRKDIERAQAYLRHRHHGRRDPATAKHTPMKQALTALEVMGAAFASGALKGRFGNAKVGPVPADLLAATVLHLAAPFSGAYFHHVANVANGIGAGYAHQLGAGVGDAWAHKTDLQGWAQRRGDMLTKLTGNQAFASSPSVGLPYGTAAFAGVGANKRPLSQNELLSMAYKVR